jgi:hypothetical protein
LPDTGRHGKTFHLEHHASVSSVVRRMKQRTAKRGV